MAREAWPKEEVIEASGEVVCLAIHRYDREGGSPFEALWPKNQKMSEWAVRLDVMGYPQVRLLDGWGRPFSGVNSKPSARNAETVREVMHNAARAGSKKPAPPKHKLGAKLSKLWRYRALAVPSPRNLRSFEAPDTSDRSRLRTSREVTPLASRPRA